MALGAEGHPGEDQTDEEHGPGGGGVRRPAAAPLPLPLRPPEPQLRRHFAVVADSGHSLVLGENGPRILRKVFGVGADEAGGEYALGKIPEVPLLDSREIPMADPEIGGNLADRLPHRLPTFLPGGTGVPRRHRFSDPRSVTYPAACFLSSG